MSKQIDRALKLTVDVDRRIGETEVSLIERIDLAEKQIIRGEGRMNNMERVVGEELAKGFAKMEKKVDEEVK